MNTNRNCKTAPVKPYDDSMMDHLLLYDNMPYVWDPDLNNENRFAIESGNIIKSYRCLMKEPYELKHQ